MGSTCRHLICPSSDSNNDKEIDATETATEDDVGDAHHDDHDIEDDHDNDDNIYDAKDTYKFMKGLAMQDREVSTHLFHSSVPEIFVIPGQGQDGLFQG
jgi:hypothetical protein